jgi:hypothetical protein
VKEQEKAAKDAERAIKKAVRDKLVSTYSKIHGRVGLMQCGRRRRRMRRRRRRTRRRLRRRQRRTKRNRYVSTPAPPRRCLTLELPPQDISKQSGVLAGFFVKKEKASSPAPALIIASPAGESSPPDPQRSPDSIYRHSRCQQVVRL